MVLGRENNKEALFLEADVLRAGKGLHVKWSKRVISSRLDFAKTIRSGDKISFDSNVFFVKESDLGFSRFAVTVSKKRFARAVVRNKVKRQHRELFRIIGIDGYDIIVMPLKLQAFSEIYGSWDKLCQFLSNY